MKKPILKRLILKTSGLALVALMSACHNDDPPATDIGDTTPVPDPMIMPTESAPSYGEYFRQAFAQPATSEPLAVAVGVDFAYVEADSSADFSDLLN